MNTSTGLSIAFLFLLSSVQPARTESRVNLMEKQSPAGHQYVERRGDLDALLGLQ